MQIGQGNNLPRVKVTNQSAVLRMIYYYGPVKRSEIAKRLELTLPTITTNVNSMISEGIVRETGIQKTDGAGFGRKARLLEIVPESRHFIGIEVTGTRRSVSIVDFCGCEIYSYYDTEICTDYEKNIAETCRITLRCLEQNNMSWEDICGVCIGLPGVVDREQGILRVHPRNQWIDKDIGGDVRRLTGYGGPVTVENNSCVRALGAQLYQREALSNVQSFTYLFVDYGIACPLIVNGYGFSGSVVGAGEVGHMVMQPDGLRCSCGNHGCLEAYSSDYAITARAAEAMEHGKARKLKQICGSGIPTMPQILEAQRLGDRDIKRIVENAIYTLAVAVSNIINFTSPDLMMIECKLFRDSDNRELLMDMAKSNLCNKTYRGSEFMFVEPHGCSGARGAAAVAINNDLG